MLHCISSPQLGPFLSKQSFPLEDFEGAFVNEPWNGAFCRAPVVSLAEKHWQKIAGHLAFRVIASKRIEDELAISP